LTGKILICACLYCEAGSSEKFDKMISIAYRLQAKWQAKYRTTLFECQI